MPSPDLPFTQTMLRYILIAIAVLLVLRILARRRASNVDTPDRERESDRDLQ
jgi:hypothetical protein